jgi:hypothetical protein
LPLTFPYGVQLTGSAEVTGQVSQTIKIEPSPMFSAMFSRMETVIQLVGKFTANGPGSNGTSSPDASPGRPLAAMPSQGTDVMDADKLAALSRKIDDRPQCISLWKPCSNT